MDEKASRIMFRENAPNKSLNPDGPFKAFEMGAMVLEFRIDLAFSIPELSRLARELSNNAIKIVFVAWLATQAA